MKNKFFKALALAGICLAGVAGLAGCSMSAEQQSALNDAMDDAQRAVTVVETIDASTQSIDSKTSANGQKLDALEAKLAEISAKLDAQGGQSEESTTPTAEDLAKLIAYDNLRFERGQVEQFVYQTESGVEWIVINKEGSQIVVGRRHIVSEEPAVLNGEPLELVFDEEAETYACDIYFVLGQETVTYSEEEEEVTEPVTYAYIKAVDLNVVDDPETVDVDESEDNVVFGALLPDESLGGSFDMMWEMMLNLSSPSTVVYADMVFDMFTGRLNVQSEEAMMTVVQPAMMGLILSKSIIADDISNIVVDEDGLIHFSVVNSYWAPMSSSSIITMTEFVDYVIDADGNIISVDGEYDFVNGGGDYDSVDEIPTDAFGRPILLAFQSMKGEIGKTAVYGEDVEETELYAFATDFIDNLVELLELEGDHR